MLYHELCPGRLRSSPQLGFRVLGVLESEGSRNGISIGVFLCEVCPEGRVTVLLTRTPRGSLCVLAVVGCQDTPAIATPKYPTAASDSSSSRAILRLFFCFFFGW